jgi:photosystem II stability/assembly factor-like uncharacterized protein
VLFLSTTQGTFRLNPDTGVVARLGPLETSVEALAVAPDGQTIVAAVTPDYGLPMRRPLAPASQPGAVRSTDGGRTWSPIAALAGRQVTALGASGSRFYAGTDPAEVLTSSDGGDTWTQGQSLRELPGYDEWSYPLAPHTPHVMLFYPHPTNPDVIFAGIEVGGIVRSDNGGRTWRLSGDKRTAGQEAIHPDIHGLAISPSEPDVVYCATPQGVYYSSDAGERWQQRITGLDPLYCRPIVVHQQVPTVAVVVATHGASGFFGITPERTGGTVLRTADAGRTWRAVAEGLPEQLQPTPAMAADPQRAGRFYLPLFSGDVFATDDAGETWHELARGLPPILRAVAV